MAEVIATRRRQREQLTIDHRRAPLLEGVLAYQRLGQSEDPPFTFKVMVVRTNWPGATARDVELQVTDSIERKLQEVPNVDLRENQAVLALLAAIPLNRLAAAALAEFLSRSLVGGVKRSHPLPLAAVPAWGWLYSFRCRGGEFLAFVLGTSWSIWAIALLLRCGHVVKSSLPASSVERLCRRAHTQ